MSARRNPWAPMVAVLAGATLACSTLVGAWFGR